MFVFYSKLWTVKEKFSKIEFTLFYSFCILYHLVIAI